jgi:hypothetical protein
VGGGAYYLDVRSARHGCCILISRTRKSTTVAPNLGNVDLPLTTSPDGRTIFYTRMDSWGDDLMLVENFW